MNIHDNFSNCLNRKEYFVYQTINGKDIQSSAIYHGTLKGCETTAKRLNRDARKGIIWKVQACK